jgi:hypothetical protein
MRVDSAAGQVGQGSTGECFQGVFASCGIPSLSNCHEGLEREDSPPIINKLMRHVNDSTIRHFGSVINVNAGGAVLLWNLAQTPDGFETVEVHKHSQLEDWRPMIEVRPPTTAALRWSALSDCMHYGAPRAPSDSLCVYGDDDVRRRSPRAFPSVHAIDNEHAPRCIRRAVHDRANNADPHGPPFPRLGFEGVCSSRSGLLSLRWSRSPIRRISKLFRTISRYHAHGMASMAAPS